MSERNNRADFERREKGLNVTRTSVRNRVIIMAVGGWAAKGTQRSLVISAWRVRHYKKAYVLVWQMRDKL
jgi:hypothetical protein